jgi:hypothetical protein
MRPETQVKPRFTMNTEEGVQGSQTMSPNYYKRPFIFGIKAALEAQIFSNYVSVFGPWFVFIHGTSLFALKKYGPQLPRLLKTVLSLTNKSVLSISFFPIRVALTSILLNQIFGWNITTSMIAQAALQRWIGEAMLALVPDDYNGSIPDDLVFFLTQSAPVDISTRSLVFFFTFALAFAMPNISSIVSQIVMESLFE